VDVLQRTQEQELQRAEHCLRTRKIVDGEIELRVKEVSYK